MKNFYDKLLLALALLFLASGAAFYFLKSGQAVGETRGSVSEGSSIAYEVIPAPDATAKSADWPEPEHQSSGPFWVYDIFTPPEIYLTKDGEFTAEPPQPPPPPTPFGVYLAEMERKPYRVQMQGFSGDRNKPEECVLFFFDEERQLRFFIREGEENAQAQVKVLDFVIERNVDAEAGEVTITSIATVLDQRTGEEVKLVDGTRLFEPETYFLFLSDQDPNVKVELSLEEIPEEGIEFSTTTGQFTLLEINLEESSVTVEKRGTEESEAETKTFFPRNSNETETEPEPPANEAEEVEDNASFPAFF